MSEIKRNAWLDNFKALLIICVVIGHVLESYIDDNYILKGIYAFIYVFHMGAFIFVSGYFSKNDQKAHHTAIRNYFFPYFFFNFLAYTFKNILTGSTDFSVINPSWSMWFLLVMFFYRFFLKYIIKIPFHMIISVIMALIISVFPFIKNDVIIRFFVYLPFFLGGYHCQPHHLQLVKDKLSFKLSWMIILAILFMMIYLTQNDLMRVSLFYNDSPYQNYDVSLLTGMIIRILNCVLTVVISCCLLKILPTHSMVLSHIGQETGGIYIFHTYWIRVMRLLIPSWPVSMEGQSIVFIGGIIIFFLSYNPIIIKIYHYLNQLWMNIYDGMYHLIKKTQFTCF